MTTGKLLAQYGVPAIRLPESVPRPAVAIGAMLVLAGLDIVGALLARRWSNGGSVLWFAAGVACFVTLFWVYGSSLRYADLLPVTFGWIVALQVGLMIIDRARTHRHVDAGHWAAATAIIVLEGYLLLAGE
jgi:apolipoprotein N-acyltransferase